MSFPLQTTNDSRLFAKRDFVAKYLKLLKSSCTCINHRTGSRLQQTSLDCCWQVFSISDKSLRQLSVYKSNWSIEYYRIFICDNKENKINLQVKTNKGIRNGEKWRTKYYKGNISSKQQEPSGLQNGSDEHLLFETIFSLILLVP